MHDFIHKKTEEDHIMLDIIKGGVEGKSILDGLPKKASWAKFRDHVLDQVGESELCATLDEQVKQARDGLDAYKNFEESFKVYVDTKLVEDYGMTINATAESFATARLVYVLKTEKDKAQRRKKMVVAISVLELCGLDEGRLHDILGEQLKKARTL